MPLALPPLLCRHGLHKGVADSEDSQQTDDRDATVSCSPRLYDSSALCLSLCLSLSAASVCVALSLSLGRHNVLHPLSFECLQRFLDLDVDASPTGRGLNNYQYIILL